jgi:hypothetical protein
MMGARRVIVMRDSTGDEYSETANVVPWDDEWIDERLPRIPLCTETLQCQLVLRGKGTPSHIIERVYDSAGLKETHYANGDVDYRDIDGFIEGLEDLMDTAALQSEFDAWDAASDEAWREIEDRLDE